MQQIFGAPNGGGLKHSSEISREFTHMSPSLQPESIPASHSPSDATRMDVPNFKMQTRNQLSRSLSLLLSILRVAATIFMTWKALCVVTGSTYPILVVSSESMEPAFLKGDLILLGNRQEKIYPGDIPVVWFSDRPLPMVHRAIEVSYEVSEQDGLPR